jgi:serine/threonine protein kinase
MPVDHARLTELFTEAFELDPDRQREIIERVAATDAPLARELATMLDADVSIVTALRTAGLKPDDIGDAFAPRAAIPAAKIRIPGYAVQRVIGKGGMGVVYGAERAGQQVAIKVLHVTSTEARARFAAEAQILTSLDHPGIVRVIATGEADDHPYFVMEYVDGITLDAHVRTAALADKLALFAAICDAVHHAHTRGVVHRDLKPANIMVRTDGRIAILDFGVARATASVGRTQQGDFLGTLMYMSPEQAAGLANEIDARADIYSLGVILFELVRGKLPYDVTGLHIGAAVRKIVQQAPEALGSGNAILDAAVANALAKQKARRPPTAAALAAEVRRVTLR